MSKKKTNIHIRLSEETKEAIDQIAAEREIPTSQLVREALHEKVKQALATKPEVLEEIVVGG